MEECRQLPGSANGIFTEKYQMYIIELSVTLKKSILKIIGINEMIFLYPANEREDIKVNQFHPPTAQCH